MIKRQKINLVTSKKQFFEARLKELRGFQTNSIEQNRRIHEKEAQLQEAIRYCNSLLIPIIQDLRFGPDDWRKAKFIGISELLEDD